MPGSTSAEITELARQVGDLAMAQNATVAVAESLTSGRIAQALGATPGSKRWFAGGVVAYQNETKYNVLHVARGPVISASCAEEMASGARDLLGAAVSVSVTGVGGPGPEEDQPQGTVFIGVSASDTTRSFGYSFDGDPSDNVELTALHALRRLVEMLRDPH